MTHTESLGTRTISKVRWRLIPFLLICYIINAIDRGNLSFAALTMNSELNISASAYGALSSIFFIPYFFFEVPSNILLHRFGTRKWIARIMTSWGIVTCATMFSNSYGYISFMRFLLGMMEAGFFPGVMYYFTIWFPQRERAKVIAFFMMALPLSGFISSPISGWILDNVNWLGLSGWRWLFFLQGIPAILFGIITWFYLTDHPLQAKWLSSEEKAWLNTEMERENATKRGSGKKHVKFKEMFSDMRVWRIGFIYLFMAMSAGIMFTWTALIIKEFTKLSNTGVGLLGMIPSLFAMIAMPLWAWHSDKTGERKMHSVISMAVCLAGALIVALPANPVIKMAGIVLIQVGSTSMMGPFWTIPTLFLTGSSAAIGVAVINSCNSFGGFFASLASGFIQSRFGFTGILLFMCVCYTLAIYLTATLPLKQLKRESTVNANDTLKKSKSFQES